LLDEKDVNSMRTIDFSPLYRSVVGFDRLAALLETAASDAASGYPPYNIERTGENSYRIEIAVAGFRPEELNIEVKENLLTVQGRKAANDDSRRYLHRGLAERNFERRFQLADYVVVTEASLADGLLSVSLKRELPEALKPRTIKINADASSLIGGATESDADKAA
jgi:molecular chaperone IbpA